MKVSIFLQNQIKAGQGRAGYEKKLQVRVGSRLSKFQQGRLQVTEIPQPAELYRELLFGLYFGKNFQSKKVYLHHMLTRRADFILDNTGKFKFLLILQQLIDTFEVKCLELRYRNEPFPQILQSVTHPQRINVNTSSDTFIFVWQTIHGIPNQD